MCVEAFVLSGNCCCKTGSVRLAQDRLTDVREQPVWAKRLLLALLTRRCLFHSVRDDDIGNNSKPLEPVAFLSLKL